MTDNERLGLLDTIQLKTIDDFKKIDDWRIANKELIFNNGFEFVIEHGVLDVQYEHSKCEFEKQGDLINITIYGDSNFFLNERPMYEKLVSYTLNFGSGSKDLYSNIREYTGVTNQKYKAELSKQVDNAIATATAQLLTVMMFATHSFELIEAVEETERAPLNKQEERAYNKAKYKYHKPIRLTRVVYQYSNKQDSKRSYSKCDYEYTVRGHYRNYKSGKRIWIQSFTKGNGAKIAKNYVL